MRKVALLFLIINFLTLQQLFSQNSSLRVTTLVSGELLNQFLPKGRIFLFIAEPGSREPRLNAWPNKSNRIFAFNPVNWNGSNPIIFDGKTELNKSVDLSLDNLPNGKYNVQILWDQDFNESGINAPGNLYSETITIDLTENKVIDLPLTKMIQPTKLAEHKLLREVNIKSDTLSKWWGKEMRLKAAVILPCNFYENPDQKYAVRYNIAGYGGRYTRASRFLRNMDWWTSDKAPEILNVYLDGEGPFGDCYQLDSENSGPYGTALVNELIPYIEKEFRGIGTPESRFVEGCSTGGWVSLALQLFYPDFFGGCFSYSPDQVDFENCQLINIYKDENAFYNEFDYLRPIVREVSGESILSQKVFIQFENVLGSSDTYVTSGGQFSAFTALFSPKGEDGLPKPMFDPVTGKIDHEVVEYWRKHDLKHYVKTNWEKLGPKIQGKIWAWTGDMDNFYLNPALRAFDEMLKTMENPKSDAIINFTPMKGHCAEYDEIKVIQQIAEKLEMKN
ncbi:MAG TPA: alpha/beta hydrolase-fold protein [Draconibacterium sp.]|nr:alpha/beta hydrolase-fold protein [Draconibacterium sp.]